MIDYELLSSELISLVEGVPHLISNLSNASALIYGALDDVSWVGFYMLEGDTLILGPFQGKPACIEIKTGRGVCGTAVYEKRTLVVPDVHKFKGHIACDPDSASEIVVPIYKNGEIWGVLDIDSKSKNRFDENDRKGLELLCRSLENALFSEPA